MQNTGLIDELRDTDYLAGTDNSIPYAIVNKSADWEKYKPTDEWQRKYKSGRLGYDTYSCVTFSALNCLEMQLYFMIKNNLLTKKELDFLNDNGYIEDGYPNFNDWFTAVMSGTTENGNTKQAVWDSIRKDGVLPQKLGYQVNDFNDRQTYLTTKPTESQKDIAKKFLDYFIVKYEWINWGKITNFDLIKKHLKQAPIHISTPFCSTWNTKPPKKVKDCGLQITHHATSYIGMKKGDYHKDLDHYNPFIKHLDWDYFIANPMKAVLYTKKATQGYTFTRDLYYGLRGEDVKELQKYLNRKGFFVAQTGAGSLGHETEFFGTLTRDALIRFQKANNINPPKGYFGPLTKAFVANNP